MKGVYLNVHDQVKEKIFVLRRPKSELFKKKKVCFFQQTFDPFFC